jgi:hypothetical protein
MPLYLPRRVSRQPQGNAAVNWANPITAGLEVAILHGQQNLAVRNLANPYLSFSTANTGSNFVKNVGSNFVGVGNKFADNSFTFESNSTLGLRNTSPVGYTLGSVAIATTSGVSATFINQDRAGGTRNFQFRVNTANNLEMITFTGGSTVFTTAPWPNRLVGGAVAAAVSGTSVSIAADGVLTKATITAANNLSNTAERLDIAKYGSTGTSNWIGTISLSAVWSRKISDDELVSWTRNPWQIFAPSAVTVLGSSITYTYARPASDITTQWSTSSGSTHYTLIDETVADDNDYIVATAAGQTDEVKLASMTPPQVGTNLVINYKVTGVDGGATVTVSLRQGSAGTLIKADTTRNANGTYALAVAPGDWALVTDWSDLRLRFVSA